MEVYKKDKKTITKLNKKIGKKMDELEKRIVEHGDLLVLPLVHRFTDELYSREIFLPKNTLATSLTHKVQHQFFLLSGSVLVWNNGGEAEYVKAPYIGITEKGTRRVVYAIEDCVWATCHPNPNNVMLEELETLVFEEYNNDLLTDDMMQKIKDAKSSANKLSKTIDSKLLNK